MKSILSLFLSLFFIALPSFCNSEDLRKIHSEQSIQTVEEYLNHTKEIIADFIQEDSNDEKRRGKLYIKKPGNVRIDYFTPEKETLIVDDNFITHYNYSLDELNYISSDGMPINFLSKEDLSLHDDLQVTNVFEQNNRLSMELSIKQKKETYLVILSFSKNPIQLKSIRVINADGTFVNLEVTAFEHTQIPDSTFDIKRKEKRF